MNNDEFYAKLNEIWACDKDIIPPLYVEGFNNEQEQIYSFLRCVVWFFKCSFWYPNDEKMHKMDNLKVGQGCNFHLKDSIKKFRVEFGNDTESITSSIDIPKLNLRLRTNLYIFLWMRDKSKENIIKAVNEVDYLFDFLKHRDCHSWSFNLILILLYITRNIGLKNDCSIQLRDKIFKYIEHPTGSAFEETKLIEILGEEKSPEQKERCITLLEEWSKEKRLHNSRYCICWLEILIDIIEKINKNEPPQISLNEYYSRLASRYIEEALSPNHEGARAGLYEKALIYYKKAIVDSKTIDETKENFLRNQKEEYDLIPMFKISFQVSDSESLNNFVEKIKDLNFKSSVDYVLDFFSYVTLDDVEEYKNYIRENSSFLSNIPCYVEHDNSVKIKHVPSVEENDDGFDFFVFTEIVRLLSPGISSCWDIVKSKITEDSNFDWIFHKNPLLDEKYQDYLNSCFFNLFKNEKYSSVRAFYSILPFIEKIVRDLAEESGASVINYDGSSFLTLGNLLDEKHFVDCIDPSVHLNLKGLLTHDKGFHIRNSRLHGNNTNIEELTIAEKYLSLFLLKFFKDINLTQL